MLCATILRNVIFPALTVVVIPALNEAGCVAATVKQWRILGMRNVRVVDNGSTDSTAIRAREAGAEVIHEPRRGYGAAAWRGIQDLPAGTECVLFSSADGSDRLAPEDLPVWQGALDDGADLVIGDRFSPGESRRHLKVVQSFGNRLCCGLIAVGWGRRFNDMGSLRLIRRGALERLDLQDRGFGWNVEMQVRAIERGLKVVELPVVYYPRASGRSKISGNAIGTCKAAWGILAMVGHLWLTRWRHSAAVRNPKALANTP